MKNLIIILLFAIAASNACAQSMPYHNDDSTLKAMKVKTLSTYYYKSADTVRAEKRLLFQKEFDKNGKLLKKYVYTFWDVVSYDHTTTYLYNGKGLLAEETTIQEILNLGSRDDEYIKMFGTNAFNKKIRYFYNEKGQLEKEERFDFEKELDPKAAPDKTIIYGYKGDKLVKEISSSKSEVDQYTSTYEYDERNNRTKALTEYSSENLGTETVEYTYDEKSRLIEEKITFSELVFNNDHRKHEYNAQGKRTKTWVYSKDNGDWVLSGSKVYDKDGKLVKPNEKTIISYYANGLVQSELWKSGDEKEIVHFVTRYEFY